MENKVINFNYDETLKVLSLELKSILQDNGWLGKKGIFRRKRNNTIEIFEISKAGHFGREFGLVVGLHFDFIDLPLLKNIDLIDTSYVDIREGLAGDYVVPVYQDDLDRTITYFKRNIVSILNAFFWMFDDWETKLPKITSRDIDKDQFEIPFPTKMRTALLLSKVNLYLQNFDRANELAHYGISQLKGANGIDLITEFEAIIGITES